MNAKIIELPKILDAIGNLSFSVNERLAYEELSLPISPVHTMDEIEQVVRLINSFLV